MKRSILFLLVCVFFHYQIRACDVCGCQLGGLSFGLLAGTNSHYLGMRHAVANFNASIITGTTALDEFSEDRFMRTEILGRYILSDRLQLHAILPYINNKMNGTVQNLNFSGIGDPSVLLFYNVLATKKGLDKPILNTDQIVMHTLLVGGGIKFPLGTFDRFDKNEVVNRNFQVGTGSFDFLLSANYTISKGKFGLNLESSYKINTANKDNYLFGNQFNASSYAFYTLPFTNGLLAPYAGVYYETSERHEDDGIYNNNTGGNATFISGGLQGNWKQFSVNLLFQSPISQNFTSDSVSTIKTEGRFSVGVLYHFARKAKNVFPIQPE